GRAAARSGRCTSGGGASAAGVRPSSGGIAWSSSPSFDPLPACAGPPPGSSAYRCALCEQRRHPATDLGRYHGGVTEAPRTPRRGAGELEAAVLGALWAADTPLTPTEIQGRVGRDLAYNTIHTIITRLADKGLVRRMALGARTGYVPVKDAAQAAADRMRDAL